MAKRTAKKNRSRDDARPSQTLLPPPGPSPADARVSSTLIGKPMASLIETESPTPTSFEVAAGRAEAEAAHDAKLRSERAPEHAPEHDDAQVPSLDRPSLDRPSLDRPSLDQLMEQIPPSSRSAVVLDSFAPPPNTRRLSFFKSKAQRSSVTRWFAIVATFLTVATLVSQRDDIARVFRRMKLPSANGLFHSFRTAAAAGTEDEGPCPKEMSLVESSDGSVRVCVDRFEASLVEIGDDGKEHAFSPYLSPVTGGTPEERHRVKAVSRPNAVPQAYISRDDSEQACTEAGKRLCRNDEWKVACGGPEATHYPYGNEEDPSACNTAGKAPLGELFPLYGEEIYDFRVMNDPSLNALPGTVALTASYPRCANSYGLYDMVGNLHEWTAEKGGEFHGGYYLDSHQNGDGCGYVTTAHDAMYHDYSTGFRCCLDVDRP